jgi:uncharacterized integral membrane protein
MKVDLQFLFALENAYEIKVNYLKVDLMEVPVSLVQLMVTVVKVLALNPANCFYLDSFGTILV